MYKNRVQKDVRNLAPPQPTLRSRSGPWSSFSSLLPLLPHAQPSAWSPLSLRTSGTPRNPPPLSWCHHKTWDSFSYPGLTSTCICLYVPVITYHCITNHAKTKCLRTTTTLYFAQESEIWAGIDRNSLLCMGWLSWDWTVHFHGGSLVVGEMVLATNFTPPGPLHGPLGFPHGIVAGIQGWAFTLVFCCCCNRLPPIALKMTEIDYLTVPWLEV